jgi:putative signal transducing protein
MWCPSCGAEYRRGFTRCADCDVELVAEPPPEPEPEAVRRVSGFTDPDLGPSPVEVYVGPAVEAEMLRAVLEGSGIRSAVSGSGLQEAYPGALPHRLVVAAIDVARAGEIIRAARTGELNLGPDETEEDVAEDEDVESGDGSMWAPVHSPPIGAGRIREQVPWMSTRAGRIFLAVFGLLIAAGIVVSALK